MPKVKSPPVDLEQYLIGREHKYVSYEEGARMCGLPYWGFVKMAKEAEATWALRKTSMVDMKSRKRMEIQTMEELVGQGKKKYVRYAEGAELYSVGKHTFEKWANKSIKAALKALKLWNSTFQKRGKIKEYKFEKRGKIYQNKLQKRGKTMYYVFGGASSCLEKTQSQ